MSEFTIDGLEPTEKVARLHEVLDARQRRAEHVHNLIIEAREDIRTHLEPDSPAWLRSAFDKLHTAHHVLGGDPFDMHIRAALEAKP